MQTLPIGPQAKNTNLTWVATTNRKKFWPVQQDRCRHLIAIALYVAFGFYVSNTSENKERIQAREAAERSREAVDSYSGPEVGKNIVADVCRKLEDELRESLSHAP